MTRSPDMDERIQYAETWSRSDLERFQFEQLQTVLRLAAQVPFYEDRWSSARVRPADVKSLADLARFPIVHKADLVKAGDRWLHRERGPVGFSTRGTSGEPLLVWLTAEEEEVFIRPTVRGFRWAGFAPGMTALLMSPVWHRLAACEAHAIIRMGGRAAFFWGSMGAEYVGSFLSTVREAQPQFVTTTAPLLLSVVRYCDEHAIDLASVFDGVHSITVVGLPLTPPFRAYLSQRLAADVFERSGTQEGAALDECACHTAPHVHEDVCFLEVVDSAGLPVPPGTRGELVVTKLAPSGSVFVRYGTDDIAAFLPEACPCGSSFRRLKIFGRPESSVRINRKDITAYDVRLCVDTDPALVGRNVVLVRDRAATHPTLTIAIEREPTNADALEHRLREAFGVDTVVVHWLGRVQLGWTFRQALDRSELQLPAN